MNENGTDNISIRRKNTCVKSFCVNIPQTISFLLKKKSEFSKITSDRTLRLYSKCVYMLLFLKVKIAALGYIQAHYLARKQYNSRNIDTIN